MFSASPPPSLRPRRLRWAPSASDVARAWKSEIDRLEEDSHKRCFLASLTATTFKDGNFQARLESSGLLGHRRDPLSDDRVVGRSMPSSDGRHDSPMASPASSSPLRYLLFSLVFHLVFTASIFDIYFTSPVVHPDRRYSIRDTYSPETEGSPAQPPADRLVLIVGDGLRADTLFKQHDGAMMPAWAVRDIELSADQSSFNSNYPWTSALNESRDLGLSQQQTSPGPFYAAPHLRDTALHRGAWGISHTRVPTESRPGHVALIAGMYEDISAVTKGWKVNPVNFDSLMNVSTHAYTFGSPDILPMFAAGATQGKVDMWTYDESAEDFTKDATHLDTWVLHQLENLFIGAQSSPTLDAQLRQKGNVFFLHLLGLDTTGHTYRPHSPEYVGNLMVVDAIIRRVEELFEQFFGEKDNQRTAWVFSADHGMSAKGNHGDGEPDNTRTPLIAWGSGVRAPLKLDRQRVLHDEQATLFAAQRDQDDYYQGWGALNELWRQDVEQADVATLMASLLSLQLPANSEGRLPLDYLDVDDEHAARASFANALEVLEIFRVKHEQRQAKATNYVPFPGLQTTALNTAPGQRQVDDIREDIASGQYDDAVIRSQELIDLALQGAQYLQTYDWLLLITIVTLGYIGSIAHGIIFLLRNYVLDPDALANLPAGQQVRTSLGGLITPGRLFAFTTFAAGFHKFPSEQAPVSYYVYLALSATQWARVFDDYQVIVLAFRRGTQATVGQSQRNGHTKRKLLVRLGFTVAFVLAALELMVLGYLQRWAWTVGFFTLGFPWAFLSLNDTQRSKNEGLLLLWGLGCVGTGLFTLGGTDKDESIPVLVLSGTLFVLVGLVILRKPALFLSASRKAANQKSDAGLQHTVALIKAQMALIVLTTLVTAVSSYHLQRKLGLPLVSQILAWLCLVSAVALPLIGSLTRVQHSKQQTRLPASQRLSVIFLAFAPIMVLLSIRDEALFFLLYSVTLLLWGKMEGVMLEEELVEQHKVRKFFSAQIEKPSGPQSDGVISDTAPQPLTVLLPRRIGLREIRTSVLFLFLLHVGFFGTGNVASISSFYLSPVYRLVPVFSPFLMAALLIFKILVPFVILCSVVHLMCATQPSSRALGLPPPSSRGDGDDNDEDDDEVEQSVHLNPKFQKATNDADGPVPARRVKPAAIALELAGPPILGPDSIGGLGLVDPSSSSSRGASYPIVVAACVFTDILALNFLFTVETKGAWLEIGRTITHFAMANLLQVFMYALTLLADSLYG